LVPEPDACKQVRYFNEVAYCTHAKRDEIIARTAPPEADLSAQPAVIFYWRGRFEGL
jgi:hypothetical protein